MRQTSGICSDADRNPGLTRGFGNGTDTVRRSDVARVDADSVNPRFDGAERKAVIKMNIRNHRNRSPFENLRQSAESLFIGNGTADNVASRIRQLADLCKSRRRIRCARIRHGLKRNRSPAADCDGTDVNPSCRSGHFFHPLQVRPARWRASSIQCRLPPEQSTRSPGGHHRTKHRA